jgi:phosphoribosylformylglycinamidine synthase
MVKVSVLRTAGTNCDIETAFAFEQEGAMAELVHINQFLNKEKNLLNFQILAIPGGFTYGDDIAAGKILANQLRYKLWDDLMKFIEKGNLIIGICNGFQVLVKAGLLPIPDGKQRVTLAWNDSGKFEDRWIYLQTPKTDNRKPKCVWTKNLPEIIYLPVAHGEGKFIVDKKILEDIEENNQIVFQYVDEKGKLAGYPYNPNGSVKNIAGICDPSGRILGLMPHPERFIHLTQHPRWRREKIKIPHGEFIFRNAIRFLSR